MIAATKYLTGRATFLTKRALQFVALEVSGFQRAVYILALLALINAITGLLRDRLLAHVFGASTTLDLYYAAFRIPDFLFVGLGALVTVYILIPELGRRNEAERKDYVDTIIAGFSILSVVLCTVAALFSPWLLARFFPELVAQGHLATLTMLTRIMLLQPVLMGFSNILAALTQTRHRYLLYSISPVLYNFGILIGTVVLYPLFGIMGLSLGVVLGAFLSGAIQLPSLISDGYFHRLPRLKEFSSLVDTVLVSVPRALALSMSEIAEFGLIVFAGALAPGSIAVFNFAYTLQGVPLSIIGASYSVAAFPSLAAAIAAGRREQFIEQLATASRLVFFWSLPATALAIVLRAHVVRVILGSGAFNWDDTRLTAAAFALFAASLCAQGLLLLLVRAYYAAGRTFVPFIVSSFGAALTIALGAASVGALHAGLFSDATKALLRVSGVPGTGVLALAFVYSFVSIVSTLVLLAHFERRFPGFLRKVIGSWAQSALAAVGCGAGAYLTLNFIGPITLSSTLVSVCLRGGAAALVGSVACAAVYVVLGNREFKETFGALRSRLRRPKLSPSMVAAAEEQV
jgi:putative peptidoglycan lipid II flippase